MQPYPKSSEKCVYEGDEKETGCIRASLADTLDLHQVDNGVHGCVEGGLE